MGAREFKRKCFPISKIESIESNVLYHWVLMATVESICTVLYNPKKNQFEEHKYYFYFWNLDEKFGNECKNYLTMHIDNKFYQMTKFLKCRGGPYFGHDHVVNICQFFSQRIWAHINLDNIEEFEKSSALI